MLKLSLRRTRRRLGRGRLMRYWEYTDLNSVKCSLSRPERDSPIFLLRLCPSLILFSRPSSIKKLFFGNKFRIYGQENVGPTIHSCARPIKNGIQRQQPTNDNTRTTRTTWPITQQTLYAEGRSERSSGDLRPHIYSFTFSAHSVQCVLLLLLSLLHIVENRYYASRYIYIPHGWMDGPHTSRTVFCQWKCWS